MLHNRTQCEQGWREWGLRLVEEGWKPYLLTFMFRHIGGSHASIMRQMEREAERVYATHVTRVVRKPTALSSIGKLPIWFGSHDRPVFKYAKRNFIDVLVNDGLHTHVVAFDPPWSRLREGLIYHFDTQKHLYIRPEKPLICIDARRITHNLDYVIDYTRKYALSAFVGEDASFVLPRSSSEMRDRAA